jgi:aminoglycoside/choline kinase family phosphotransferase
MDLKQIDSFLNYSLPESAPEGFTCIRLIGDASTRSYFRIQNQSGCTSCILMQMPEPFLESDFAYLQNYYLLRDAGIPLAEVYGIQPERGIVYLQDLGNFTFYDLFATWDPQTQLRYFLKSLEYLHQMEDLPPVNRLAFNTEKFLWEMNYFRKYFLEGLRGIQLTDEEGVELQHCFERLCGEISENISVYSHRDYHSRNLMVHEDGVFVIDFQDARLGPVTYDLASLCYDSYIQHSPDFRKMLERMFFIHHPDAYIERFEYPRVCLQRNLKALGTFGYQTTLMGRDFYLQFVAPTLSYVKEHLQKLPDYEGLRKVLQRHIPELRNS